MIVALVVLLYLVGGIATALVVARYDRLLEAGDLAQQHAEAAVVRERRLEAGDLGFAVLVWPFLALVGVGVGAVVGLGRLVRRIDRLLS